MSKPYYQADLGYPRRPCPLEYHVCVNRRWFSIPAQVIVDARDARFDATLLVRCLAGGGCSCEDYYYLMVNPQRRAYEADGFEDRYKRNLKEGDEYVEL